MSQLAQEQVLKNYSPLGEKQPLKQPLEKMFPEYPVFAGMFNIPASFGRNPTDRRKVLGLS